ncbi:hypothetical protein PHSY_000892 [Pseudozyma hubeiensis SY62]|uniref:SH3 domain-containing protein n=1 Tax=Pseudozyma hubeiensis (strain SY62) TaxID=1305764 RepID=R9NXQ2_PSEHS|nr:hypothetical protein PHSY_000892 [Pseudozyma hubeiensis SY62]GAC93327.1 hypothetical protein PHSY_000892 [Pseudozyma hubeiensis SY62]
MPSFPYLAKATIKYKSPHKQDLTFAKGEIIRVTGVAPKTDPSDDDDDDDDDWLVGETLDGSKNGTFPGSFVEPSDELEEAPSHEAEAKIASAIAPTSAPGAISSEVPAGLQGSVVEEEPPSHQAEPIPEAAREAARKSETEETGFGAPLPPRPPSPDEDHDQAAAASATQVDAAEPAVAAAEAAPDALKATDGASKGAAGAAVLGAAGGAAASSIADASKAEVTPDSKATASSPTKSPPAVASKPVGMSSSFRDRLAAFNKPAESAPPPVPKGKPGGWKRPAAASNEAKPLVPGASASASTTAAVKTAASATAAQTNEATPSSEPSAAGGAFSAADAQTSIKMSLKERMAALQRNEAAADESAPQTKPKPAAPGKIGADRRNVAMQGMGLAPGAPVPARKSSVESGRSVDEPTAEPSAAQESSQSDAQPVASEENDHDANDAQGASAEAGSVKETEELEESAEPKEALTEEEQEAERRAAIAKRMAALGARRMGGGPSPFGAPAPPARTKTNSSVGSVEGTTSEPGISVPAETAAPTSNDEVKDASAPAAATTESSDSDVRSPTSQEADEEPKVLAVPRRTAAPRKRKPAPQAAAFAAGVAAAGVAGGAALADASEPADPAAEIDQKEDVAEAAVDHADPVAVLATPEEEAERVDQEADETTVQAASADEPIEAESTATHRDDDAEQQLEESDPEIAENQRQLEEYLRGEGFYEDQVEPAAAPQPEFSAAARGIEDESPGTEAEVGQPRAVPNVPREDLTSPKPPSRPPSTRPPVPKTTLPPPPVSADHEDAIAARAQSPSMSGIPASTSRRGSAIPPIPTSVLPTPIEAAADEVDEPEAQARSVEQDEAGPVLAAPRPRMAVPTEDPEDEQLLAAADAPATAGDGVDASEATVSDQPEEQELTEEEQEAQRRANLARRMAALGGQRIGAFPGMAPPPIMGAPMPARKAPAQDAGETEEHSNQADGAEEPSELDGQLSPRGPPRGGMAIPGLTAVPGMNAQQAEDDALERAKSPDAAGAEAPARLASPPPVPTSPPPKPMSPPPPARLPPTAGENVSAPPTLPPGRPSSTVPMPSLDEAVRSASPANSALGRRTSMKPPVPQGISAHSRESSAVEEQELAQDRELATSPPPLPVSPPPLPVSPPPRPSSRAPPLPGAAGVPPRRQGSSASYTSMGAVGHSDVPGVPSANTTPATELPGASVPARTEASLPPTPAASNAPMSVNVGARQSSRDLDLMPSSRWWRHGVNPLRLPPTVAGRPDAILYADTSSSTDTGVTVHRADVYMLFEDYSTTVISLSFQDDDHEETHTSLSQRHNFAPSKPSSAELKQWSSSIGAHIAKLALDSAKQSNAPIGDGSPRALVQQIISATPSLPPVGSSLGALILTQVGPTVMDTGADEVRPGDIVLCSQADFRGKKGLAPYHTTLGATEPTPAIVVEVESKKNKLRCVLQSPSSRKGLPEEVSLRLDDLKSGIVKVFRVPPRQGWVQNW